MSAAAECFGIAELLEQILLQTISDKDLKELFILQKVNKSFRDAITGSPKLQQMMWLRPQVIPSSPHVAVRCNPECSCVQGAFRDLIIKPFAQRNPRSEEDNIIDLSPQDANDSDDSDEDPLLDDTIYRSDSWYDITVYLKADEQEMRGGPPAWTTNMGMQNQDPRRIPFVYHCGSWKGMRIFRDSRSRRVLIDVLISRRKDDYGNHYHEVLVLEGEKATFGGYLAALDELRRSQRWDNW